MALYPYQERVRDLMLAGESIILQAPTGAGKTIAALTPFLETYWDAGAEQFPRKCIYAVPMRVLVNQFTDEFRDLSARHERRFHRPLAIGRQTGEYRESPEFREPLIFATIDQVLSSWLMHPYSLSARKGNMNAGAFVGSYLVFDEFHLFAPDSTLPTTLQMLKTLRGVSPFLLMTATFSAEMLEELAKELAATTVLLEESDLAGIPSQRKRRFFHTIDRPLVEDETAYVDNIVAAHLAQPAHDQRSLVVCNQVNHAQCVYRALLDQPALDGVTVRLLHSRFLKEDRQAHEDEIRREFHKDKARHTQPSMIVVATQVVEVGLDMSCRALHTALASASAVLQRAGRCARYERETGNVYVYAPGEETNYPYHEKLAAQQCALTWEWLQLHNGEHLTFAAEQALINHAHTPADRLILDGLRGTELQHRQQIYELWHGAGSRAEAARLVRDIQAISVVVHSDPDQLRHAPFAVDSFSLYPGTVRKAYNDWQEANELLDAEWDEGRLEWLVKKLIEDESEEDAQANRPIRYAFKEVAGAYDLYAPLLVVHPRLVSYSSDLGLQLTPDVTAPFESKVPPATKTKQREAYSYRLESYERHIELVRDAFEQEWEDGLAAVSQRIETAYDWQPDIVCRMARLVVCLHDTAKLSIGWQTWVRDWQAAIGRPMPAGMAAAHSDYDPDNGQHRALQRTMGRKPTHAVESAYAAAPLLLSILPDKDKHRPLFRAAFTAISRHHGPFTSQPGSYELINDYEQYLERAAALFPELAFRMTEATPRATLVYDHKVQRSIDANFLIQPGEAQDQDVVAYMVMLRALRYADQEGTRIGTQASMMEPG
jgi:CRISPR-associated endonuclease/helicase Cas3